MSHTTIPLPDHINTQIFQTVFRFPLHAASDLQGKKTFVTSLKLAPKTQTQMSALWRFRGEQIGSVDIKSLSSPLLTTVRTKMVVSVNCLCNVRFSYNIVDKIYITFCDFFAVVLIISSLYLSVAEPTQTER